MTLIEFINALEEGSYALNIGDVTHDFLRRRFQRFNLLPLKSQILFGCQYIAFQQSAMRRLDPPPQYSLAICSNGALLDSVCAACDIEAAPIRFLCPEMIDPIELSLASQAADLRLGQMHKIMSRNVLCFAREDNAGYEFKAISNLIISNTSGNLDTSDYIHRLSSKIHPGATILLINPGVKSGEIISEINFNYREKSSLKRIMFDHKNYLIQSFIYGD